MEDMQTPEGELIDNARRRSGLSAREAAGAAGISEGRWRHIVKGYQAVTADNRIPAHAPADTLARMAEVVGVSASELEAVGRKDAAESMVVLFGSDEPASSGVKFPAEGIQNLILNHKRGRSYVSLAKDCGGVVGGKSLQKIAVTRTANFGDPGTIKGLARGLNVSVGDVIRAYAVSMGLPMASDEAGVLRLSGAGHLPESAQTVLVVLSRELQNAYGEPRGFSSIDV